MERSSFYFQQQIFVVLLGHSLSPGMYTALWAGFVPYLKAKLSIGEDVLGLHDFVARCRFCLSMAIAGKLVKALGVRESFC